MNAEIEKKEQNAKNAKTAQKLIIARNSKKANNAIMRKMQKGKDCK